MDFTEQVEIAAPPDAVWPVIADVERWHEWTASITKIELLDGELEPGARARIKQPKFPAVVWRVTKVEPGRYFEWENRSPGLYSVGGHRVEPTAGGASIATLTISQQGPLAPLLGLLADKLTRPYMEMEANGLKQRVESQRS